MPEATKETVEMMVKSQLIEAAPLTWKTKFYESALDTLDQTIVKLEVFRQTETSVVKKVDFRKDASGSRYDSGQMRERGEVTCFKCGKRGTMQTNAILYFKDITLLLSALVVVNKDIYQGTALLRM